VGTEGALALLDGGMTGDSMILTGTQSTPMEPDPTCAGER
jgi:hypothetical protein